MKKYILIILASAIATVVSAQVTKSDTAKKVYKNEFGIDATGFIKQFLNFNSSTFQDYYSPTYYLTYRRYLKCGNIRFAIGGSFADYDLTPAFIGDSNKYHYNSYSLDTRIGWEFQTVLSKHWQVFYGLDFRQSIGYTKNDAPYWNGGYANGYMTKSQIYGIAPLLGFRFLLNKRLSISTETSFSINQQQEFTRKYYIPVTNQYPPLPSNVTPKTKKIISGFSQPISLFLTFNI